MDRSNRRKTIEKQKENLEKLFQLIKENPELPIIPMVDSEIVADIGYSWWMGSWGDAEVDKYICTDERIYLKSQEDVDIVENFVPYEDYMDMSDEELEDYFENLPWIEAIMVCINLPEYTLVDPEKGIT